MKLRYNGAQLFLPNHYFSSHTKLLGFNLSDPVVLVRRCEKRIPLLKLVLQTLLQSHPEGQGRATIEMREGFPTARSKY